MARKSAALATTRKTQDFFEAVIAQAKRIRTAYQAGHPLVCTAGLIYERARQTPDDGNYHATYETRIDILAARVVDTEISGRQW